MKRHRLALVGLAAVLVGGAAADGWGAARAPATIIRATGLVRLRSAETAAWTQVVAPFPLHYGDELKTISGRATVEFADGSRIYVSRLTTFKLEVPDTSRQKGVSHRVIRLVAGLIRSVVKPLKSGESYYMVSAGAIAAIKGTDFAFDGTSVIVFDENDPGVDHVVVLSDAQGAHGVEVREGQMATVHPDGSVGRPVEVPPDRARELKDATSGPEAPADTEGSAKSREVLSFKPVVREVVGALAVPKGERGPVVTLTPREAERDQWGGAGMQGYTGLMDRAAVSAREAPLPPAPPPPVNGCEVAP
ncbi:MAG: hypothetical protein AAB152_08470 [Candidatus Coatesbacteria bacterium]